MTEGGEVRREGKRERGMEGGRWEEGEKLTERTSPGEARTAVAQRQQQKRGIMTSSAGGHERGS